MASNNDYRYQKAFRVQRLSLNQGLSQSVVQDIIQDQQGFIWLATEDGLNRFDSYQFKVFRHDLLDDKSLHENWVISLLEEPGVGIWVGTVAGVSFFDPKTEEFKNYSQNNPKLRTRIHNFLYDNNGTVWVATDSGLYYVDHSTDRIRAFESDAHEKINQGTVSLTENGNFIFVATESCLYRISKKTHALENLCQKPELKSIFSGLLNVILADETRLWVGTTNGLFLYNTKDETITEFHNQTNSTDSLADNYIQDLLIGKHGGIWIATTQGLDFYNKDKNTFRHYKQQLVSDEGLSSNDVISLFIDCENLIWLGTYGGGANVLDPNQQRFEHLLTKSDVAKLGDNNTIHGIETDPFQNLWLASFGGGLIKYDLLTGKVSRPLNERGLDYDKYVYAVKIDSSLRLWVASLSDVTLLDLKTEKPIATRFVIDGKQHKALSGVKRIFEDHSANIWLGTDHGLLKVISVSATQTKSLKTVLTLTLKDYTSKLPNSFASYNPTISTITEDKYGDFWFGGLAGLIHYRVSNDQWKHYYYDSNNPQSLTNDDVQVIYEDSQGFIWVGTADGLNRLVRSEDSSDNYYFARITTHQGLPNNSVYGILEDEQQQLWISTNLGIIRYADNVANAIAFRSNDGLSSDEFNTGAYHSDTEGRLYFGSINGITVINDQLDQHHEINKPLIFTRAKVSERMVNLNRLNSDVNPTVTLKKSESTLDIQVASISYTKMGTQRYRYRVLPLNKNWQYLETQRNIFVAGLAEGNYRLEIQSRPAGRKWNANSKVLAIVVKADFWQSSTAYYLFTFLIIVLFAVGLWGMSKYYQAKMTTTNRRFKVENLRVKELRIDNETLRSALAKNEQEISLLQTTIQSNAVKLSAERFKDLASGFYSLDYLFDLAEQIERRNLNKATPNILDYDAICILELVEYQKIHDELGANSANQFIAMVADTIRTNLSSRTEIFAIQEATYLFLGKNVEYPEFENSVVSLCKQIERSVYDVANGITKSSLVFRSIIDVTDLELINGKIFNRLIDIIVKIQQHLFVHGKSKDYRISFKADFINDIRKDHPFDFEQLNKNDHITIQP